MTVARRGARSWPRAPRGGRSPRGLDLRECYGLTETAGPLITQFDTEFPRPGYIGRAFADPRFQVERAQDGEMLIRAPLLFRGYWRNPEETDAVLRHEWFHTGDLIERAERGERTSNGKVKRSVAVDSFADLVVQMYDRHDETVIADHVRRRAR